MVKRNKMNDRKNFKISKKLFGLLVLQGVTLTAAYILIIFFYQQNIRQQQANASVQLNHTLLSNSKYTVNTLNQVTQFPVYRSTYKFEDAFYQFLLNPKTISAHPGEFETAFDLRTVEMILQYPVIESIRLYDASGKTLSRKLTSLYYVPYEESLDQELLEQIVSRRGSLYFLSDEELTSIGRRPSGFLLYAGRLLHDPSTMKPLCIVISGIYITDIFVDFNKQRLYEDQLFGLYHESGKMLFADSALHFEAPDIDSLKNGSSTLTQVHDGIKYEYYINYDEKKQIYSVIEIPLEKGYGYLANVFRVFHVILLGVAVLILLTTVVIIYSITRPLNRLVDACRQIGKGDFSARVTYTSSDELGYLTSSFNHMSEKVEKLITEVYVKSITERDLELQMLRSQINPHFLYNTLESMRMSAYAQGFDALAEMCRLLAKVLRYGVSMPNHLVTVSEELEHLKDYTMLLEYRFHNHIRIHVQAEEALMELPVIKLLLQPLVENCINHGLTETGHPGEISVWAFCQEANLIFTVTDNGSGMPPKTLQLLRDYIDNKNTAFKSIGLKNIHRRIKLYYGEDYGLTIDSKAGRGTSVTILLPVLPQSTEEQKDEND